MSESSPVDRILNKESGGGVLDKAWRGVEGGYDSVGLMSGENAPAKRFVFGNILGSGIMYVMKPGISFGSDGTPRPWALTAPNAPNKTAMPFWMPGLAFGFFSGFMV
jgi:hypothetical protein